MKKAQIIIYAILNHFDKAVKIALECGDVNMAKAYANKPEDKKLKKKLRKNPMMTWVSVYSIRKYIASIIY